MQIEKASKVIAWNDISTNDTQEKQWLLFFCSNKTVMHANGVALMFEEIHSWKNACSIVAPFVFTFLSVKWNGFDLLAMKCELFEQFYRNQNETKFCGKAFSVGAATWKLRMKQNIFQRPHKWIVNDAHMIYGILNIGQAFIYNSQINFHLARSGWICCRHHILRLSAI